MEDILGKGEIVVVEDSRFWEFACDHLVLKTLKLLVLGLGLVQVRKLIQL